jgi:hypothetical protein
MDKKEELVDAVLRLADDDGRRLACAAAFALAGDYKTEIAEIGRICNENNVKICKCQLGCFE